MIRSKDASLLKRLDLLTTDEDFRERVLVYARRKIVSMVDLKRRASEAQLCSAARKFCIKWNGDD